MLAKRIIPCLDVKEGQVVKGIRFRELRRAGDPVALARFYDQEGADELVFLDITASAEKRELVADLAEKVAKEIFIPFTIGGGIRSVQDIRFILRRGADKVSLNTAAVLNPDLIRAGAEEFGSQCIVLAMDVVRTGGMWKVVIYGGKKRTELDALEWAQRAVELGAGEILLTSMDADGTRNGFDLQITRRISGSAPVPVIASGGGGTLRHFYEVLTEGGADAALAASVFHFGNIRIGELKKYLFERGVPVRRASNETEI